MLLQIQLAFKLPLADAALVLPVFFGPANLLVIMEVRGAVKSFATLLTPEWFGIGVLIHVTIVMPSMVETFTANFAENTELTFMLLFLMHLHRRPGGESFAAVGTADCLTLVFHQDMIFKLVLG